MLSRVRGFLGDVEDLLVPNVNPQLVAGLIERRRGAKLCNDVEAVRETQNRLLRLRSLYPHLVAEEGPLLERARELLQDWDERL